MMDHYILRIKYMKKFVRLHYETAQFLTSKMDTDNSILDFWDVGIFSGENRLKQPLLFKYYEENKTELSHFLPTTLSIPFVISESLYNEFQKQSITGIDKYNLIIHDKKGTVINERYVGLIVTGRINSTPDWSQSLIVSDSKLPKVYYYKGLHYDWNKWDKSDFCLEQTKNGGGFNGRILITNKVVKIIKDLKIKNINFEPCESFLSSKSTVDQIEENMKNF